MRAKNVRIRKDSILWSRGRQMKYYYNYTVLIRGGVFGRFETLHGVGMSWRPLRSLFKKKKVFCLV